MLFIVWVAYHFLKEEPVLKTNPSATQVSVLIPFRDEAENLPHLLTSLLAQSYPKELVEFIFIDDHSSDTSTQLLVDYTLVLNEGEGKKAALATGLKQASGELVVTLDADCRYGPKWLETIVNYYEYTRASLLIAPVKIAPADTLWEKFQALEFQSLAASAAGAALGQHPIMCNGANLAFKRSLYNAEDDVFRQAYASGDDMFLMEYAKSKKVAIAYVKSKEAMASTRAVAWSHFWHQRFRWTSKSNAYQDLDVIISALVVLLTNLSLLVLPFISLKVAFIVLMGKLGVDLLLLALSAPFFGHRQLVPLTILLTPIYPLYVFVASVGGLFNRRWK